jgi:nitric oxide reductase subunit C
MIFQEKNCTACHQLFGLGGYLGPDLTTVISEKGKGELYVRAVLGYGMGRMPDFRFSAEEIDCLVSFLAYVDSTATTYRHRDNIMSNGGIIFR